MPAGMWTAYSGYHVVVEKGGAREYMYLGFFFFYSLVLAPQNGGGGKEKGSWAPISSRLKVLCPS